LHGHPKQDKRGGHARPHLVAKRGGHTIERVVARPPLSFFNYFK
jgi:hypothetical protein